MASTGTINKKFNSTMGVIHTTHQRKDGKPYRCIYNRVRNGVYWCLDNGIFTGSFVLSDWLKRVEQFSEYKDTCLFIAIPDVIGNCSATLDQFSYYRSMVKDFPVALVSQDGIKDQSHRIPWESFDCVFVGGSDRHKLGREGGWIVSEAKKRGKWIHIGRVNSVSRILKFWQADSWDGTSLSFDPSNVFKFHAAVLQVRAMKKSKGLFDEINP